MADALEQKTIWVALTALKKMAQGDSPFSAEALARVRAAPSLSVKPAHTHLVAVEAGEQFSVDQFAQAMLEEQQVRSVIRQIECSATRNEGVVALAHCIDRARGGEGRMVSVLCREANTLEVLLDVLQLQGGRNEGEVGLGLVDHALMALAHLSSDAFDPDSLTKRRLPADVHTRLLVFLSDEVSRCTRILILPQLSCASSRPPLPYPWSYHFNGRRYGTHHQAGTEPATQILAAAALQNVMKDARIAEAAELSGSVEEMEQLLRAQQRRLSQGGAAGEAAGQLTHSLAGALSNARAACDATCDATREAGRVQPLLRRGSGLAREAEQAAISELTRQRTGFG